MACGLWFVACGLRFVVCGQNYISKSGQKVSCLRDQGLEINVGPVRKPLTLTLIAETNNLRIVVYLVMRYANPDFDCGKK